MKEVRARLKELFDKLLGAKRHAIGKITNSTTEKIRRLETASFCEDAQGFFTRNSTSKYLRLSSFFLSSEFLMLPRFVLWNSEKIAAVTTK